MAAGKCILLLFFYFYRKMINFYVKKQKDLYF